MSGSDLSMSGSVELRVSPERCLFDDPLRLEVIGLIPGQDVSLRTELTDEDGESFTSLGRYRAGSGGELELSRSPALEGGTFTGVEAEGPLWALEPRNGVRRMVKKDVRIPLTVRFSLHQEPAGDVLSTAVQERSFLGEGVSRIPVREGRVRATLFIPPGPGQFPGIIDLYGTGGGLVEHRASLLANHGFVTMALAFYGYDDLPSHLGGLRLDYFREALEFLKQQPKVKKQEIGIIGLSKGAELAITMATFLPGIKAVVSINGCNANTMAPLPCDGFVLPCLGLIPEKVKFTEAGIVDFSESTDDPMDPAFQECIIPAERSSSAFLLLSGLDDKNWPSASYSKQFVGRQEELRRLEELRNQELQKRKQFHMRHEEEQRRREEEMIRQREQEDLRRQEGFKAAYMDTREQDMRMGDMGVRGAINMGDAYNPAPAGTQGPPPMMGMSMNNRATVSSPSMGPGASMGSEGTASLGAAMMPDNGAVRNDRFSQPSPSQMGSPMVNRAGTEAAQPAMGGVNTVGGGPGGYGRGSQGGNFDGSNKRHRY